jgi:hypothetical protein
MNLKVKILLSIITLILNIAIVNGQTKTDLNLAKSYFMELDSLCNIDNGKLWGINLYGATMFIFPGSRVIVANEQENDSSLIFKNGLFLGRLPDNINIANTSIEWNGKNWTMLSWDAISNQDNYSRAKLLIHESWHRQQKEIGIMPVMTKNTHLDELNGGILLKLEFIILDSALTCTNREEKINHLANALKVRSFRQSLFPDNNENVFELHEGMAEYTGFKLCGIKNELLPKVAEKLLEFGLGKDGLANSFPYLTGPAYGILFDGLKTDWLADVKRGESLPEIGKQIIKHSLPQDSAQLKDTISKLIKQYQAKSMIENETLKFENQKQLITEYNQKFFNGHILIIKNDNIQMGFNPQEKLVPLQNGVVYKTMRLTGEWGIAEIKNGIFRSNDWQYFLLSAPTTGKTGKINEPDYTLVLNNGWEVVEIKDGKYTLNKK